MPPPTSEAIEAARKKVEQAKARLQALEARASTARRKLEARRKIILGSLIITAARDNNWPTSFHDLTRRITRDVDLRAFDNWSLNSDD